MSLQLNVIQSVFQQALGASTFQASMRMGDFSVVIYAVLIFCTPSISIHCGVKCKCLGPWESCLSSIQQNVRLTMGNYWNGCILVFFYVYLYIHWRVSITATAGIFMTRFFASFLILFFASLYCVFLLCSGIIRIICFFFLSHMVLVFGVQTRFLELGEEFHLIQIYR